MVVRFKVVVVLSNVGVGDPRCPIHDEDAILLLELFNVVQLTQLSERMFQLSTILLLKANF